MSVNSKMTAIADAIRGKTGDTVLLTLDGMAAAIAGLKLGSTVKAEMGTVTASGSTSLTISHSLGAVPTLVMIYNTMEETLESGTVKACGYQGASGIEVFGIVLTQKNVQTTTSLMVPTKKTINASQVSFTFSSYTFNGDYTYILGVVS